MEIENEKQTLLNWQNSRKCTRMIHFDVTQYEKKLNIKSDPKKEALPAEWNTYRDSLEKVCEFNGIKRFCGEEIR